MGMLQVVLVIVGVCAVSYVLQTSMWSSGTPGWICTAIAQ